MPSLMGGIVVGLGALVRPETPLILAAAGAVLVALWWRPTNWRRLLQTGILLAVGLILPLLRWAARNWRVVHTVQFLAPRYTELPDEFTPRGFYAWSGTWLSRFRDVYQVMWNQDGEEIRLEDIPASAFDSPAERERVAALLTAYNEDTDMTPEIDRGFGQISRERTARHPLRTYFTVPLLRCFSMWFTPRVEMLPLSGKLSAHRLSVGGQPVAILLFAGTFLAGHSVCADGAGRSVARAKGSCRAFPGGIHRDSYCISDHCGNAGATLRAGMFSCGFRAGCATVGEKVRQHRQRTERAIFRRTIFQGALHEE